MIITEKFLSEVLYDILNSIPKPWKQDKVEKELERYIKSVVYRTLANYTQGRMNNYIPVVESILILGKEETLKRLSYHKHKINKLTK